MKTMIFETKPDETDLSSYILNDKNKYITVEYINNLLIKYNVDYKVRDIEKYQRAMSHVSYIKRDLVTDKINKLVKEKNLEPLKNTSNVVPLQTESYERLEYLGDSIIHAALAEYLYKRYPDKDEGFLTKIRIKIENGETLAKLARQLGLHEFVLLAKNIEMVGGRNKNTHIFEDTFESFLGALFVDSCYDYQTCRSLVTNIVETHIDLASLIYNETNYKDLLLRHYHKMKWTDPEYKLIESVEKDNKKIYTMGVTDSTSAIIGSGSGPSKKKGEQIAAQNALIHLGIINDCDSDEEIFYNNS
jgi:dsRNA-specific ribonuclease